MENNMTIQKLLRANIRSITPYSSARSEFTGNARIFLDANENFRDFLESQENPRNRYPDPFQKELKEKVAAVFGITPERLFLGNGSDEAIDLLFRAFAEPREDKAVILPPTYGVYKVFADLNDVETVAVPLREDFTINLDKVRSLAEAGSPERLKLLFICSPNNPTGNAVPMDTVEALLDSFPGIVVVDEAYQDFNRGPSAVSLLGSHGNLVVLKTFSKAWGLANVRFGCALSSPEIAEVLKNIKYPYNLSGPAQETAMKALETGSEVKEGIERIINSREKLSKALKDISYVDTVFPSDANFILVRVKDADLLYSSLKQRGVIIRNRTTQPGCWNCVRITVGSETENTGLLSAMKELEGLMEGEKTL